MYGNRDLKPCFYIPSLEVLQNPCHNLDISLVYTARRQSRAFVPSLPVEPLLVTPSRGQVDYLFASPKNRFTDHDKTDAPEKIIL